MLLLKQLGLNNTTDLEKETKTERKEVKFSIPSLSKKFKRFISVSNQTVDSILKDVSTIFQKEFRTIKDSDDFEILDVESLYIGSNEFIIE